MSPCTPCGSQILKPSDDRADGWAQLYSPSLILIIPLHDLLDDADYIMQVLWVSRCSLPGLDGLSALPALRELYASYNDITDLQPLDSCSELEVCVCVCELACACVCVLLV